MHGGLGTALQYVDDVTHVLVVAEAEVAGLQWTGALHERVEAPHRRVADDAVPVQQPADR